MATIVVKNVYDGGKPYTLKDLPLELTIAELKSKVEDVVEEHPAPAQQRLIHCGKICLDTSKLADTLSGQDLTRPQTFHLVLSARTLSRTKSLPVPASSSSSTRAVGSQSSGSTPVGGHVSTPPSRSSRAGSLASAAPRTAPTLSRSNTTPIRPTTLSPRTPQSAPAGNSLPGRMRDASGGLSASLNSSPVTPAQPQRLGSQGSTPQPRRPGYRKERTVSFSDTAASAPGGASAGVGSNSLDDALRLQEAYARGTAEWYQHFAQAVLSSPAAMGIYQVFQQQQWLEASRVQQQIAFQSQCAAHYTSHGFAMSPVAASAAAAYFSVQGEGWPSAPNAAHARSSAGAEQPDQIAQYFATRGWPRPVAGTPIRALHPQGLGGHQQASSMSHTTTAFHTTGLERVDTPAQQANVMFAGPQFNPWFPGAPHAVDGAQPQAAAPAAHIGENAGAGLADMMGPAPQDANPAAPQAGAPAGLGPHGPHGPPAAGRRLIMLIDLKLALKMIFMVVLLGQDGGPLRWLGLSCLALAAFLYQTGIVAALFRPGMEPQVFGGEGGLNRRAQQNPYRVRSILEGGVAQGGGAVMDFTYLITSFLLSLSPTWSPIPAVTLPPTVPEAPGRADQAPLVAAGPEEHEHQD